MRVAVLLSIWRLVFAGKGAVSGMTLGAVLTYTLIAEVFGEQLTCRTQLDVALWEGTVATVHDLGYLHFPGEHPPATRWLRRRTVRFMHSL